MATISENLQILKDSTDAIKQAIVDKGGTIEGDITTWADAIGNIQTGGGGGSGGAEEEITFTGTILEEPGGLYIQGTISPELSDNKRIWAFAYGDSAICSSMALLAGNTHISFSLSGGGAMLDLNSSKVSMFISDLDGDNAQIIKII